MTFVGSSEFGNHGFGKLMFRVNDDGILLNDRDVSNYPCWEYVKSLVKDSDERPNTLSSTSEHLFGLITKGDEQTLRLLIEDKADLNLQLANDRRDRTKSLLQWACCCGRISTVRHLLAAKANINRVDSNFGNNALMTVMNGADDKSMPRVSEDVQLSMTAILLSNNIDVNIRNLYDSTALMYAASLSSLKMATILLNNGADRTMARQSGKCMGYTARDEVGEHGHLYLSPHQNQSDEWKRKVNNELRRILDFPGWVPRGEFGLMQNVINEVKKTC